MNPVFISRYRVLEEVGRGGMGIVYKAEDPRLERLVAVKILPPKLLRNKEALRRFLREAKVAAKLDHQNIIPIYDVGEDNGVYFMVMEYLEGKTLREWLESRTEIHIITSLSLFIQIAKALDYAHLHKVIHRDVKPENIMVLQNGTVKVMDFGIAVMDDRHSLTQPGAVMGTIAYVAPEQSKGKTADVRSDIYSLGVVLYETLTGELPFQAATPSEMLAHHLQTPPPAPSSVNLNVPKKLDGIVFKTLQKDPEKRYQSVASLMEDLEEVSELQASRENSARALEPFEIPEFLAGPALDESIIPLDYDKAKMVEGLQTLLAREISATRLEKNPSKTKESQDSLAKYRAVVNRIQKDLEALNQHMGKSALDGVEVSSALDLSKSAFQKALNLYQQGQHKEALLFFQELLRNKFKTAELYLYMGLCFIKLNRVREALTAFRKGTELDSEHGVLWQNLGDAAVQLSHDLEALQAYEKAVLFIPTAELWLKLGKVEENLNRFQEARRAVSKALELDPQSAQGYKALVRILLELSQFDEALLQLKKLLQLNPKDVESLRLLGEIYKNTNRYNLALQAYQEALSLDPKDSQTLSQLGELHEKQNQPDLALANMKQAVEALPENPDAYVKLANLYLQQKEDEAAITCFEKASTLTPHDPKLHKELGTLLLKKNSLDEAMVQFEWTIALDPADSEAHGRLGQIYYKRDQTSQSIKEYKTAIELDPYNPEFHENLGMIYYVEEDFEEAIEEIQRAITLDPGNIDYRKALGIIYETKGKLDLARKEYQKAVDTAPKDYLAQTLLGRVYLEQGLTHLSVFQFQKALALEPESHLVQSLLGKANLRLGKYEEAISFFQKALLVVPKGDRARANQVTGKTYFYLGQSFLENSQVKQACEALEKAAQLLPGYAKAFHLLGKAQYLAGNREMSRQNLEQAAKLSSKDAEIFSDLAEMLANSQDYDGAIQTLTKAVQIIPEHAPYHGLLGDLYARKGNLQEAIHAYQQALQCEKSKKGLYHGKLGNLFMQKKDYADAASEFKKAIEVSSESWYYHQELARAYKAVGKIDEAIAELEKAKNKSADPDALSFIGEEIDRLKKKKL